jgi:hypothetical protein
MESRSGLVYTGVVIAVLIALVGGFNAVTERVTDREVAIKTTWGKVDGEFVKPEEKGLVWYNPFASQIHKYPLWMQSVTIAADDANLRTKDNQRIVGSVDYQFQIDPSRAPIRVMFDDFHDNVGLILHQLGKSSAVEVFGKQSAIDLAANVDQVREQLKEDFQSLLDKQKLPFLITSVAMSGIGLSDESNRKLEALMLEQQRSRVLDMRLMNAEKEKGVAEKETAVTVAALAELKRAGVPDADILGAYCLQLAEKEKRVNEPFAPGCLGGGLPVGASRVVGR